MPRTGQRPYPWGVRLLIGAVWVCLVPGAIATGALLGAPNDPVALILLLGIGLAAAMLQETVLGGQVALSFASVVMIAAVAINGAVGACLVGIVIALPPQIRIPLPARLFNAGVFGLSALVAGIVYHLVGGVLAVEGIEGPRLLLEVGLPLAAATAVECLVNGVLVAAISRLDRGMPIGSVFWSLISSSGVAYLGYGVTAFLLVVLWGPAGIGIFSALLIVAPLAVAQWAVHQFGEQERAHEETLNALVEASERRHPYAAGHGNRVAATCAAIGQQLQLAQSQQAALRQAARLHDVGLTGARAHRAASLGQADGHTRDDPAVGWADKVLMEHPSTGVQILEGITFLRDSLPGVLSHHERYDGQGYPQGLAGEQIPLLARVIAVADAYDALTGPIPGHRGMSQAEALAEIVARAGLAFDPEVVRALTAACAAGRLVTPSPTQPPGPEERDAGAALAPAASAAPALPGVHDGAGMREAGATTTLDWVDHDDPISCRPSAGAM